AARFFDDSLNIGTEEPPFPGEPIEHGTHNVVDRALAVGTITHDQVEHCSEQLSLQVNACGVVAERAGRTVGGETDALRRDRRVSRLSDVAADKFFEMGYARGIAHRKPGASEEEISVE